MGKQRKPSARALAVLVMELTPEELLALLDDPAATKEFAQGLLQETEDSTYFTHLADTEVGTALVERGSLEEEAQRIVENWRKLASDLGYTGPIAWQVKAGFTLKQHAPKAGSCYEDFKYLQDWNFKDEPTKDSIVFWIPRLAPDSTSKTADEQLARLAEVREEYGLPTDHLTDFGSVSLIAGLILAEFKRSGDRVPANQDYVRTDTRRSGGCRLDLGGFGGHGLYCHGRWWDGGRRSSLGVFPLGVGY